MTLIFFGISVFFYYPAFFFCTLTTTFNTINNPFPFWPVFCHFKNAEAIMNWYLDSKADKEFSSLVIELNSTTKKDRKDLLFPIVKERTKILIYQICQKKLYLDDEKTACVYLSINEEMDRIISSYKISSESYNHYLKQLCTYHARRIIRKDYDNSIYENEFFFEDDEPYQYDTYNDEEVRIKQSSNISATFFINMNLKETVEYIISNANRDDYLIYNQYEGKLRELLKTKSFRRDFLLFILSLPLNSSFDESNNYSRIFRTDEEAFIHLLDLKIEIANRKNPDRARNIELTSKHWRLMAKLKRSMYFASNEKEYSLLKENYNTHAKCHNRRLKDTRRSYRGMIHEDISSYLKLSRTTVTTAIGKVKKTLEMIISSL